uniref:phenylalanine 4-monooxygenase n=3 Tax=Angomonas deanei TaxID=59799 RepID=U5KL63_9TRYP|nr:phenylalanine 4-monooxygenase [Angomonas deanei]
MLSRCKLLRCAAGTTMEAAYASTKSNVTVKKEARNRTSLEVSLGTDSAGALCDLLAIFKKHNVNISQVANRPQAYENKAKFRTIFLDVDAYIESREMKSVVTELNVFSPKVVVAGSWQMPWYPSSPKDLDHLDQTTLAAGADLQDDPENPHPGFHDAAYRARRKEIVSRALNYKHGDAIPIIDYNEDENYVWSTVYDALTKLYPTHACEEYNYVFPLMIENGVLSRTKMPQLRDVSAFLHQATGFRVRPVAGLLSSRDFLNGLAFRIFFSTQYIRHHKQPLYTPEPDMVHDIVGHLPLLADPDFASFTQAIGLASLGADDELLGKLAKLYWYTLEFGLCEQGGGRRVYGAGILSSAGEIVHSLSGEAEYLPFDPKVASVKDFPITKYQPTYFVAKNFKDAQKKLEEWVDAQNKSIIIKYNPFSQEVQSFPRSTWKMLQEEMKRSIWS